MPDPQNPDTLPGDFFAAPGSKQTNPDTLPGDFFANNSNKSGTGSPLVDAFINRVTKESPLNPVNWPGIAREVISNHFGFPVDTDPNTSENPVVKEFMQTGKYPKSAPSTQSTSQQIGSTSGDIVNGILTGLILHTGAKGIEAVNRPNVTTDAVKAWSPSPNDSDFPIKVERAMSDVKTYGGGPSPKPTLAKNAKQWANYDFAPTELNPDSGTDNAINILQGGMDKWIDRAEQAGIKLNGDKLVQAVKDSIPARLVQEDPTYVSGIIDRVQKAYGGQQFSPSQFRDFLRTGNASDSPFYSKLQTTQGNNISAGSPSAIDAALTNGIRNELYPGLDPEGSGAGPREIQDRTGSLISVRNQAEKQHVTNSAQKPGAIIDVIPAIGKGIANVATGGMLDKLSSASLAHPLIGPKDALIARLMKYAPDADPIPLPKGDYPRLGTSNQITSGDIVTPAPADTSFVKSVQGVAQPPNPARALPASSTIVTPQPEDESGSKTPQVPINYSTPPVGGTKSPVRGILPEPNLITYGSEGKGGVTIPDILNRSTRGQGTPVALIESADPNNPTPRVQTPENREILSPGNREWIKSPTDVTKGQSVIITPRGQEVSNTAGLKRGANPEATPYGGSGAYNPEIISRLKFKKSYVDLSESDKTFVDNVVSGKSKLKLSDLMK